VGRGDRIGFGEEMVMMGLVCWAAVRGAAVSIN
jgi:hypothetical protein